MGKEIYNTFTREYIRIIYFDGAQRGHGKILSCQVEPIVDWYKQNNPGHSLNKFWKEFKEMFIDRNNILEIQKIAESLDVGVFNCLSGLYGNSNIICEKVVINQKNYLILVGKKYSKLLH